MADSDIKTELILRGRIARKSISLVGAFEGNELKELSGSVQLKVSLSSVLNDLGVEYSEAATVLKQLVSSGQNADIVLEKLAVGYRKSETTKSVQVGLLITVGGSSVQFALLKNDVYRPTRPPSIDKSGYIVGLDLRSDKTALPKNFLFGLVGDISIGNLGVYYASEAFEKVEFYASDAFQDASVLRLDIPEVRGLTFPKGLKVSAEILVGGVNLLDQLAAPQTTTTAPAAPQAPPKDGTNVEAEEALSKGTTFWIEANKSIGPLSVRRIGLSYDAPRIGIKLDAGLQLSVLTVTLEGLGLTYPIDQFTTDAKKIWEHLRFQLDGATVSFAQGPLTISGGLIKVDVPGEPDALQLDGTLLIRTQFFALTALGSYRNLRGTPSLFVFAALHKELGGPPFFFVTGLAVGFGINRALKLPTINEVHNFPLIKAATDPDYLGKDLDLRKVSEKLGEYIYPLQGNFWIAAGVKFTSFGQIDSFALLSVSFGTQLEIALMGMSKIRVPKLLPGMLEDQAPAIAFAELAFKVAFTLDSGLLSFEARLTENSFVLRKDFKLRGGFAFYSWFAGAHEGDFVVSIGGYHPRFQPPAHYPKPDVVEFACKIGDAVTIRGSCYFALCPAAIMAGGSLSIVYELGGIRAWFIAYADFLIQWKPLYYDISIGITVGVALRFDIGEIRVSLSIELSAAVDLYGPPLGGEARISLYIATFTVQFGKDRHVPPPLLWESGDIDKSFAKSFLPNPHVITITITDGLLKERKDGEKALSFVAPQKLAFSALTLVPATDAQFNTDKFSYENTKAGQNVPRPTINGQPTTLGVRPMGKSTLHSLILVTLEPTGDASPETKAYLERYLDVAIVTKSVPLALWGSEPLNTVSPPEEQMIDNTLAGLEIRTKPGPRPGETPVLDLKVLAYDRKDIPFDWTGIQPRQALLGFGNDTIANTITKPEVVEKRRGIIEVLLHTGRNIMKPEDIQLNQLSENADYIFQDLPAMARVGQNPPRDSRDT